MDFVQTTKTAIESLRRNKLRSSLTALGIIIGISAIITLISIGTGLQDYISTQFESMGANSLFVTPGKFETSLEGAAQRPINKLTFALTQELDKNKGPAIVNVTPYIEIQVSVSSPTKSKVTTLAGATSAYLTDFGYKPIKGRMYTDSDDKSGRRVALLGPSLATTLYKNQNPIGKTINISKKKFTIVGVLNARGNVGGVDADNFVAIPISAARKLTGSDQVTIITVTTTSTNTIDQAKKQVKKILDRSLSEDDYTIMSQEQLLSSVQQILGVLTFGLGSIAAISLIVGGVGISNIMLVSVTERTREIGLRKALGATSKNILYQFLIEAIILSLLGGIIGITIGFGGSLLIGQFLKTSVPLWAVGLGLGFSTLVGIIFGVAPAIRASKLEPIAALRYE